MNEIVELHWLIVTQPMAQRITQKLGRQYNKDCHLTQDYKKRKQLVLAQEIQNKIQLGKFNQDEYEQNAISNAIEVLASQGCEFVRTEGLQSVIGANDILRKHGGG